MGVDIKRFDKIMLVANKKLGGLLEAINRGDWCEDQRSLIKAYAFGLHDEGGERHALAAQHVRDCSACAAYVRSLRGLSVLVPAPALLGGAAGAGGGIIGALTGLFKGGAGGGAAAGGAGTAAGGGGATLLGGVGAKSAALCVSAVCAAGGGVVIGQRDGEPDPRTPASAASRASPQAANTPPVTAKPARTRPRAKHPSGNSGRRAAPDPDSQGAQEIAELGIEPQATSPDPAPKSSESLKPRPAAATEFGIEGP